MSVCGARRWLNSNCVYVGYQTMGGSYLLWSVSWHIYSTLSGSYQFVPASAKDWCNKGSALCHHLGDNVCKRSQLFLIRVGHYDVLVAGLYLFPDDDLWSFNFSFTLLDIRLCGVRGMLSEMSSLLREMLSEGVLYLLQTWTGPTRCCLS